MVEVYSRSRSPYALSFVIAGGLLWRDKGLRVFGAAGVFGYVGHLAWEIFENSLLFPFVLSTAGLAIIALGILYVKNRDRIQENVVRAVPTGIRRLLPTERDAR